MIQLLIDNTPAWESSHHLPVAWPWLFDPLCITESRRLHNTVFDGAARFGPMAARTGDTSIGAMALLFEEVRPDAFPRALGVPPDAVIRLDAGELERRRPFRYEAAMEAWDRFLESRGSEVEWERATLTPLRLPTGNRQRDALALSALAQEFRRPPEERAEAVVEAFFGRAVSRPARALEFVWIERAQALPAVAWRRRFSTFAALRSALGFPPRRRGNDTE